MQNTHFLRKMGGWNGHEEGIEGVDLRGGVEKGRITSRNEVLK